MARPNWAIWSMTHILVIYYLCNAMGAWAILNSFFPQATYGCRVSSFVGLRTAPHHPEHQLRMRRPQRLKCMLGFTKISHAYTAIKWACDRLCVEVTPPPTAALSSEAILNSWTTANREGHPPHVIILDCRANKQLDVEAVARLEQPLFFQRLSLQRIFCLRVGPSDMACMATTSS